MGGNRHSEFNVCSDPFQGEEDLPAKLRRCFQSSLPHAERKKSNHQDKPLASLLAGESDLPG